MAKRKGSEFNNINETWQRNEQDLSPAANDNTSGVSEDLQNTIEEEAAEYDNANKEDRLLDGDRASVEDTGPTDTAEEQ